MGCALEIGRVNKERGIVSFTWLIPLTSPFALSHSLSHAPCLILYFSHATYTSPSPPFLLALLHSLPLYLLSLPLFCSFASLSRHTLVSSVPFIPQRLQPLSGCHNCPSPADWRGFFYTVLSPPVLVASCGTSSQFSYLFVNCLSMTWNTALFASL